ncbi:MAG: DUF4340 domain-containing protein [Pirellulaceae bacterium]
MNDSFKTILFVAAAAVSAGFAYATYVTNQPKKIDGFEFVGQPFFENLDSSNQLTEMELYARNQSEELESFVVGKHDGLWTIDSHNHYPAEAAQRLAETLTAITGLEREALAGRLASDHQRLGVVDPRDGDTTDPEANGKRIILHGQGGTVLADLIVGHPVVGSPANSSQFYVRRSDEQQTYQVTLNINISTRFTDWIDAQLLPVTLNEIVDIQSDNYELVNHPQDPLGLTRIKQVKEKLHLAKVDGQWQLDGLDEAKEKLNQSSIWSTTNTLSALEIVGVRAKFQYNDKPLIGPDLKVIQDPELVQNPQAFNELLLGMRNDLQEKGYYLQSATGSINDLQLIAETGELSLTTEEGIRYTLDFGKPVEGDQQFIEIGTSKEVQEGEQNSKSNHPPSDARKNRYVMVRVNLDESKVGGGKPEMPVAPEEPAKPDGYTPMTSNDDTASEAENKTDLKEDDSSENENADKAADDEQTDSEAAQDSENDAEQDAEESKRNPAFADYEAALAQYEQDKIQYEIDLSRYEKQLAEYQQAVADVRERVNVLNERFGAWYYVVSASTLDFVQVSRDTLVEAVEPPPADNEQSEPTDHSATGNESSVPSETPAGEPGDVTDESTGDN